MAKKTFTYAAFTPSLWDGAGAPSPLSAEVDAPPETGRTVLRTRFVPNVQQHDEFRPFTVVHDVVRHYNAYASDGQNKPDGTLDAPSDSDQVQEHTYVQPREFLLYEFAAMQGRFYATNEIMLKDALRRYRESESRYDIQYHRRLIRTRAIEADLRSAEYTVSGYALVRVLSATPIETLDVEGDDIGDNPEVQAVKNRAERIKAITLTLQREDEVVRVQITDRGTVVFPRYPGDDAALDILLGLEPHISRHSSLEALPLR